MSPANPTAEYFCNIIQTNAEVVPDRNDDGLVVGYTLDASLPAAMLAAEMDGYKAKHPPAWQEVTIQWVIERWHAEVANRPLRNVHRRALDTTWRQVIRRMGGDPAVLLGPDHDDLVAANPDAFRPAADPAPSCREGGELQGMTHADWLRASLAWLDDKAMRPAVIEHIEEAADALDDLLSAQNRTDALIPAAHGGEGHGDERLRWFLTIMSGAGGVCDAGDYPGNWLNAFCDDRPGEPVDTFNLAINRGLTDSSHDSDTDGGRVWLTDTGKAWVADLGTPRADEAEELAAAIRAAWPLRITSMLCPEYEAELARTAALAALRRPTAPAPEAGDVTEAQRLALAKAVNPTAFGPIPRNWTNRDRAHHQQEAFRKVDAALAQAATSSEAGGENAE